MQFDMLLQTGQNDSRYFFTLKENSNCWELCKKIKYNVATCLKKRKSAFTVLLFIDIVINVF